MHTEATVFVVALVVRLLPPLRSGGFGGNYGYDASVYYAGAAGLINGRAPYDGFVFLHPPVVMLVLSPLAWLGKLTSDHVGFVSANLAFSALGAVNAVLVVRLVKRLGLGSRAAAVGGLFYALWYGAVGAEYLARLEPLGNFFVLLGFLGLARARDAWPVYVAAGVAFGLATSVKAWWAGPLLAVLIWQVLVARAVRQAGLITAGAVAAALLVDGPFFLRAPSPMWSMIVAEQLGRNRISSSPITRLGQLTTIEQLAPHLSLVALAVVVVGLAVVFGWLCLRAWRRESVRFFVLLAVVQIALLMLQPPWFSFYTDFVAVTAAVTIAGASATLGKLGWSPTVLAAAITMLILVLVPGKPVAPFPGRSHLAASVAGLRCVQSDSPMGLIELNALDRSFRNGCRNWVDVTGRTYGIDAPTDRSVPRARNRVWQRDLQAYLLSGDAVILVRRAETGVGPATSRAIEAGGSLASARGHTVYRVRHR